MALENYIPWLVVGGVAASAVAGCTAVCTLHYTCKGKNDSSKDRAKYIKKDKVKQHVQDGVVLTDTTHTLKIYAAATDSQTMLSNELEQKDSTTADLIAKKDIGPLTVAALMDTVSSGLSSVSNFFNNNKEINIAGDQNVIISDNNTLNVEQPNQGLDYEVEVGEVNEPSTSNKNYLNMLEERIELGNSADGNNPFILDGQDLELGGDNIGDNKGDENI